MDIHYLGNSGFALSHEEKLLIIDCIRPKAAVPLLSQAQNATVLASHAHADHFCPRVLDWAGKYPVQYVFSSDIEGCGSVIKISEGQTVHVNGMAITAYGSTDAGVSFHILWKGISLFHAGDLNNWHWRDESTAEEADEAEHAFLKILDEIRARVSHIDYAFFPLDPRLGTDYWRGALQFAAKMRPDTLYAMHFGVRKLCPPEAIYRGIPAGTRIIIPETD